nr:tubulin specific chaperone D [Hymenolepis microstoma]
MCVAGCLLSLANICKFVPRTVLCPHARRLLNIILEKMPEGVSQNALLARLRTKVIQRVGLLFCPRRAAAASWRYQRGYRSLEDNLTCVMKNKEEAVVDSGDVNVPDASTASYLTAENQDRQDEEERDDVEEDYGLEAPEEVAVVIDHLIDALRNKFTCVRWSAAKGVGRICSRLTAPYVEDVLTAILDLCTRLETYAAWHGACFALAELGRRCLLLPEKLPQVIPVVLTALFYDEKSGECNFGSNVRDAACYCCWAFARAYKASDFACHVQEVSQKLVLSSLFDRELNVRRAAAAAFQENVGRQHLDVFYELLNEACTSIGDIRKEETLLTRLTIIFGWYQEQPHLLDPYLPEMLSKCISIINENIENPKIYHFIFKIIHLMTKTRGYKSLVRLMPHTVDDLELVFDLLRSQDENDRYNWQTRYVLLLWLSIVIMVPFALERLEKSGKPPLVERIISEAKRYVVREDITQIAAAHLLAKFISRPDVYPSKLEDVFLWSEDVLQNAQYGFHRDEMCVAGCLLSLANICKFVPRTVLCPHARRLLNIILEKMPEGVSQNALLARLRTKVIQRVGLLFCPRRAAAASWRYQRGYRSLEDNLTCVMKNKEEAVVDSGDVNVPDASTASYLTAENQDRQDEEERDDVEEDYGLEAPEEVAVVIDHLIDALRNKFTCVRWSAAKGVGRICSRLTAPYVEDVLTAILDLCTRLETYAAWHGACFALAELGRRCLLLPEKLPQVIPVVLTALFYDEKSGECNFGSNVRDAACYCCWAFARAYKASDFACHVQEVSQKLVLSSLFDRELNVRRAAAAAFQENVGRQGQFPNGIEIITTVDYFAVGNISNCYLNLSKFVAGFDGYASSIVEHLAFSRLGHWDENIRDMAARALNILASLTPEQMKMSILPQLFEHLGGNDLYMRQGSVLGISELIQALSDLNSLPETIVEDVIEIVPKLEERKLFNGVTGELMRRACSRLIEKVSISKLPLHDHSVIEKWRHFLDDCLNHKEITVRDPAIPAYAALISTYAFANDGSLKENYRNTLLAHLLECLNARTESPQIGYLGVLARAPGFLFVDDVEKSLREISASCRPTKLTHLWANARQQAFATLTEVVKHIGVTEGKISDAQLRSIYIVLLGSLADYTTDSRGDIGSIVREAGMKALLDFISNLVICGRTDVIEKDIVEQVFVQVAQQAVEKIDRTRAVAGRVFVGLLHHEPEIPHILHKKELRTIFSHETLKELHWLVGEQTFPLFVQLLDFPEFVCQLVLGFSVSVGGVTENTVKASAGALRDFLVKHASDEEFLLRLMKTVGRIFANLKEQPRLCLSLLRFLEFLLCDPVIAARIQSHLEVVDELILNTWNAIHLSKDIPKLKASVDIYGAALQFPDPLRSRAALYLTQSLRHKYPIIRKVTAAKLYECILVYDVVDPDASSELSDLLSETVWEQEVTELKPTRLRICELLGVQSTRPGSAASIV